MGIFASKNTEKSYNDIKDYLQSNGLDKINIIFSIDYSSSENISINEIKTNPLILNDTQRFIYILNQFLNNYIDETLYCYGFGDAITNNLKCFDYFYRENIYNFEDLFYRYEQINNLIDSYQGASNVTSILKKSMNIYNNNRKFTLLFIASYNDTIIDNITEFYDNIFIIVIYLGNNKDTIKKLKKCRLLNIKIIIYKNIVLKSNIDIGFEISKSIIKRYKQTKNKK
jgi:hypothetical protein